MKLEFVSSSSSLAGVAILAACACGTSSSIAKLSSSYGYSIATYAVYPVFVVIGVVLILTGLWKRTRGTPLIALCGIALLLVGLVLVPPMSICQRGYPQLLPASWIGGLCGCRRRAGSRLLPRLPFAPSQCLSTGDERHGPCRRLQLLPGHYGDQRLCTHAGTLGALACLHSCNLFGRYRAHGVKPVSYWRSVAGAHHDRRPCHRLLRAGAPGDERAYCHPRCERRLPGEVSVDGAGHGHDGECVRLGLADGGARRSSPPASDGGRLTLILRRSP